MICLCPRYGAKASFDAQSMMGRLSTRLAPFRGPSRSSTALDPEPAVQTDPKLPFISAPADGRVGWEAV